MKNRKKKTGFIALCVTPAIVLFIIFMIIPTIDVDRKSTRLNSSHR